MCQLIKILASRHGRLVRLSNVCTYTYKHICTNMYIQGPLKFFCEELLQLYILRDSFKLVNILLSELLLLFV